MEKHLCRADVIAKVYLWLRDDSNILMLNLINNAWNLRELPSVGNEEYQNSSRKRPHVKL